MPSFNMSLAYEDPGLGDLKVDDPYKGVKLATAKWTGELLQRAYPGHAWHVEVVIQPGGGLIKIRLNGIMPPNRWYCCQMRDVVSDPGGKRTVLKGAGELLERYRLARGRFDLDHWRTALNEMPIQARLTGRGHIAPLID